MSIKSTREAVESASRRGEKLEIFGDPDQMRLLFKVEGRGWQKSTKAMQVPGGCLVQVSTETEGPNGTMAVAEALALVPGARIEVNGSKVQLASEPE